jgi:hypothetical protein
MQIKSGKKHILLRNALATKKEGQVNGT